MLEFRYLECVFDELGIDESRCCRKMANGRRATGAITSLVNDRGMQLERTSILHETLLISVLMYGLRK